MLALLHCLFQLLLVIAKQGMDFTMRFVADGVNLRTELLARSVRILIEQRLNSVVVLLEQRPDLLLLFLRIILSEGEPGHSDRDHDPERKLDDSALHLWRFPRAILDAGSGSEWTSNAVISFAGTDAYWDSHNFA